MIYNKFQYKKVNDKKIMHKCHKQWIVMSAFLFSIGTGATVTTTTVHADTTTQSQGNNVSSSSANSSMIQSSDKLDADNSNANSSKSSLVKSTTSSNANSNVGSSSASSSSVDISNADSKSATRSSASSNSATQSSVSSSNTQSSSSASSSAESSSSLSLSQSNELDLSSASPNPTSSDSIQSNSTPTSSFAKSSFTDSSSLTDQQPLSNLSSSTVKSSEVSNYASEKSSADFTSASSMSVDSSSSSSNLDSNETASGTTQSSGGLTNGSSSNDSTSTSQLELRLASSNKNNPDQSSTASPSASDVNLSDGISYRDDSTTSDLSLTNPKFDQVFHYNIPQGFMNDIQTVVKVGDHYNIYYLSNPQFNHGGDTNWALVQTKDFKTFVDKGLALQRNEYGWNGVATGSIVENQQNDGHITDSSLPANALLAFFTSFMPDGQKQYEAYSTDGGLTFQGVPNETNVLSHGPGIDAFRDPKVFYNPNNHKLVMYVSEGTGGAGSWVHAYTSDTGRAGTWTYLGDARGNDTNFTENAPGNFECPNIITGVKDQTTGQTKAILFIGANADGHTENYYSVGTMDASGLFHADQYNDMQMLDGGGDNYAANYLGTGISTDGSITGNMNMIGSDGFPINQSILNIGWLGSWSHPWGDFANEQGSNHIGSFTLPRISTLVNGKLQSQVITPQTTFLSSGDNKTWASLGKTNGQVDVKFTDGTTNDQIQVNQMDSQTIFNFNNGTMTITQPKAIGGSTTPVTSAVPGPVHKFTLYIDKSSIEMTIPEYGLIYTVSKFSNDTNVSITTNNPATIDTYHIYTANGNYANQSQNNVNSLQAVLSSASSLSSMNASQAAQNPAQSATYAAKSALISNFISQMTPVYSDAAFQNQFAQNLDNIGGGPGSTDRAAGFVSSNAIKFSGAAKTLSTNLIATDSLAIYNVSNAVNASIVNLNSIMVSLASSNGNIQSQNRAALQGYTNQIISYQSDMNQKSATLNSAAKNNDLSTVLSAQSQLNSDYSAANSVYAQYAGVYNQILTSQVRSAQTSVAAVADNATNSALVSQAESLSTSYSTIINSIERAVNNSANQAVSSASQASTDTFSSVNSSSQNTNDPKSSTSVTNNSVITTHARSDSAESPHSSLIQTTSSSAIPIQSSATQVNSDQTIGTKSNATITNSAQDTVTQIDGIPYDSFDKQNHIKTDLMMTTKTVKFTSGKRNIKLKPKQMKSIKVLSSKNSGNKLIYRVKINGKIGMITTKKNALVPLYYRHAEVQAKLGKSSNFRIKIIKTSREYKNLKFTDHSTVLKKGKTLKVKSIQAYKGITRFQLENGHYITSNKYFVKIK